MMVEPGAIAVMVDQACRSEIVQYGATTVSVAQPGSLSGVSVAVPVMPSVANVVVVAVMVAAASITDPTSLRAAVAAVIVGATVRAWLPQSTRAGAATEIDGAVLRQCVPAGTCATVATSTVGAVLRAVEPRKQPADVDTSLTVWLIAIDDTPTRASDASDTSTAGVVRACTPACDLVDDDTSTVGAVRACTPACDLVAVDTSTVGAVRACTPT